MTGRFQRLFVGSNLKMYKTNRQTLDYLSELQELTRDISRDDLTLFILPSYTALVDASRTVDHDMILIGAQNMHWEEQGQFTGEISPLMLREIGVNMVMVGHAERRHVFGETDWMINKRVLSCLAHHLRTLICIGETADDKEYDISAERLREQLKIALNGVGEAELDKVWVAYEPVWAIGEKGVPSDPAYANRMHELLHETLETMYPSRGFEVPVLYGGSVNLGNALQLITQPAIDGLFIGRAAWDAKNFYTLIRSIQKIIHDG